MVRVLTVHSKPSWFDLDDIWLSYRTFIVKIVGSICDGEVLKTGFNHAGNFDVALLCVVTLYDSMHIPTTSPSGVVVTSGMA